jgi:Protein of unknown function (DUF1573).
MKQISKLWLAGLVAASFIASCGQKKSVEVADSKVVVGHPKIVFEQDYFDFGTIKQGEIISHTFFFKNEGDGDLMIKDAIPSCGCTTPKYTKQPVLPGERGQIELQFDSDGWLGLQMKEVTLKFNGGLAARSLTLKGNVVK